MPKLKAADPAATLATFRKLMKENGVDAYIVPSEDPHMSEYPPDCCARRVYISNFTGSAGTAVITADKALLWTDGRYGSIKHVRAVMPARSGVQACPVVACKCMTCTTIAEALTAAVPCLPLTFAR